MTAVRRYRRDDAELNSLHRVLRASNAHWEVLCVDSMACDSHHGDCDQPQTLFHVMCGGLVTEIFAYEYYSVSVAAS